MTKPKDGESTESIVIDGERMLAGRRFQHFLDNIREGEAMREWGDDLRELIQAVRRTGNAGELQITLKVELVSAENGGHVCVMDKTKTKRPRPSHDPSHFAVGPDGQLSPLQVEIPGLN